MLGSWRKLAHLAVITLSTIVAWSVMFAVMFRNVTPFERRMNAARRLAYTFIKPQGSVEIVNMPIISERRDIRGLPGCVQKKPQVLMIGVPKCGTGTVRTFLSEHPDIAMEMNSEGVQYFNARYHRGWLWYLSQMPCSEPGQLTVENSAQYFVSEDAPARIAKYNPDMKLIVTLRDPVARLMSEFMQMVVGRPQYLNGPNVETNIFHKQTGEVLSSKALVSKSLYIVHLTEWLKYFNASQIHLVDGDEFGDDPVKELVSVETFLGVRNYFNKDKFAFVESRGFYCLRQWRYVECLERGKGRPHPYISPKTINKLKDFFRPYNEELFKVFNKRFNWA